MPDIDNLSMLRRLPNGVLVNLNAVTTIDPDVNGPDSDGLYMVQISLINGTYWNALFHDKEEAAQWIYEFSNIVNNTLVRQFK